jgi:hypothetical protein
MEELLREACGLASWVHECRGQFDLLVDVLDRHSDAMRRNEPEASFDVYEVFSEASCFLRQMSEAFIAFDKQFLNHVNKLYDEAERENP